MVTKHSWDDVVQAWGRGSEDFSGDIARPATTAAIAEAEARLGITLPAELRDLYAIANGLPALRLDMYGVRSVAELLWFRDAERELIEIWDGINRDGGYLTECLDLMRAGLAVSTGGDEDRLFLVPTVPVESAGPDDWQLYQQTNGGDGVIAQEPLVEHLLWMMAIYYPVEG